LSRKTENIDYSELNEKNKLRGELREANYMLKSLLELSERLMSTFDIRRMARFFSMSMAGNLGISRVSLFVASPGKEGLESVYSLGMGTKSDVESIKVSSAFVKWLNGETSPAYIDNIYKGKSAGLFGEEDWLEQIIRAGLAYVCPLDLGTSLPGLVFFSGRVDGKGFDKYGKELLNTFLRMGSAALKNALNFKTVSTFSSERNSFSVVRSKLINHRSFKLNTPLTVLKSALWSMESIEVSEALMLDMAKDAAKHLESGISELANISEIEFNETGLRLELTDISAVVEEYLRKVIPEIEEKNISVLFSGKIHREIRIDRAKIKIAVGEIIDNAVRFLPEGGNLRVSVAVYETGPNEMEGVELKCWENRGGIDTLLPQNDIGRRDEQAGSWIVLRVKDNGVGIPEREIEKIVQPFCKASNSGDKNAGRMGAGLSLSQKIISNHGGQLFCRSTEGEGTEFSIWIPAGF
jgi:signal transduction histidine kinase